MRCPADRHKPRSARRLAAPIPRPSTATDTPAGRIWLRRHFPARIRIRRRYAPHIRLGLMNKPFRTLALALNATALGACTSTEPPIKSQPPSPLLGTWAEIVTTEPANSSDGRQMIERTTDGKFKLVFVRTHPRQPPCTGTWSHSGTAYRMVFTSVACFGSNASKPIVGSAIELDLVESSPSRLRFKVPAGAPFATWQARLEGGIE